MEHRPLGSSGLEVSALSLGSWRTFERIPRADGLAVMTAAREAGITFLDDARYDDETGKAPIPTGYSEVVFGELFRAAGWRRDEVVVANKLWWEFWPEQTPAQELDASLRRIGLDHVDLVYTAPPPAGVEVEEVAARAGELVAAGKARAWGLMLDPGPELVAAAGRAVGPAPAAIQTAYSLVRRSPLEDAGMDEALAISGAGVVATAVMAGGALTGKYAGAGAAGRLAEQREDGALAPALGAARALAPLAAELGTTPAALAIAFALSHARVASVLFGATSPSQIAENRGALALLPLGDDILERLCAISG
jgi:aryl-alcohol dehydrogenase-like predicted oxidoreductase